MTKTQHGARVLAAALALAVLCGVWAAFPQAVAAASDSGSAAASSPQTAGIGTGPYLVFAISGGLMTVWLGLQVYKGFKARRDQRDQDKRE